MGRRPGGLAHFPGVPVQGWCRADVPVAGHLRYHGHYVLPLWEQRLSAVQLAERRDLMGPREFERGYRQRAISEADLLWQAGVLDAAKALDLPRRVARSSESFFATMPKYMGVDLSITQQQSTDVAFFVIVVVGVAGDGMRWVLECQRFRALSFAQQCRAIVDAAQLWNPVLVKVESNGYQQSIIDHLGATTVLPIKATYTGAAQHRDLDIGMPGMAAEWENGKWRIPWGDVESQRHFAPLVEELGTYPNGVYQDTVMALFFARECFRQASAHARILTLS